jgi:transposase
MVSQPVLCRHCKSSDIVRYGTQSGTPRFKCKDCGRVFKTEYLYRAYEPDIKEQIVEMAMNGSGIRDTARVLGIAKNTVLSTLKKSPKKPLRSTPTSVPVTLRLK